MVSDSLSERGTVRGGKGGAEHDLCTPVVSQAVREAYRTSVAQALLLSWREFCSGSDCLSGGRELGKRRALLSLL